jgi:hypothetical protein
MSKRRRNSGSQTINPNIVSERQRFVIECIRMRLTETQSLEYLKEVGFPCSPSTLYREKYKVEEMKLKRLYHIASIGFVDQHLDRIDNTELCLKLMWQNYNKEQDPYKRFQMLKDIILVQPYLSSYYETTKLVMQQQQPSSTAKIYSNNNIDDNQEKFTLDRESYSEDDNRKF